MSRRPAAIALACCAVLAAAPIGCGRKEVQVVSPDTSVNLSGRWNDEDSRTVAASVSQQALAGAWITEFRDRTGRKPIVRIAQVVNRSNEEIATQVFTDDLEQALVASGRVRAVASRDLAEIQRAERADIQANSSAESAPKSGQEQAPDFLIQGTIKVQHDQEGAQQVKFYQVNLKVIDATTNEMVCPMSAERKKLVTN